MFSRRPGFRFNRGRIPVGGGAAAAAATPLTIFGASLLQWCEADQGTTIATGVSQWNDLSGNAKHYTQGTGSAQPLLGAAVLNGLPVLQFDGAGDSMASALDLPAPGTTPTHMRMIVLVDNWVLNRGLVSASSSAAMPLNESASTPELRQGNNGVVAGPVNAGAAVDAWVRLRAGWTNSTADYLRLAATNVTGTDVGNNTGTGRQLGSLNAGASTSDIWVAAILYLNAAPTAQQDADLDAYWLAKWGATVGF